MKKVHLLIFIITILASSCSDIPNKSIFEKLDMKELAKAIESDPAFADFYEELREAANDDKMSETEKATYYKITYRKLFDYVKFIRNTDYWIPLRREWENEWNDKYGAYLPKADSVINYWKKYLEDNALDKYVKIELARINKTYYYSS